MSTEPKHEILTLCQTEETKIMLKKSALNSIRMDKTAFSVCSLDDESDEKEYWLSKTPVERIYGVEIIRQMLYGYDPTTARLQRFFETAELS